MSNPVARWVKFNRLPAALQAQVHTAYWKGIHYYAPLYRFPLTAQGQLATGVYPVSVHAWKKRGPRHVLDIVQKMYE